MISIYEIGVQEHRLVFHGICDESVNIDRLEVYSTSHNIRIGWVELFVCDQLLYKGPYLWFNNGGMDLNISKYMGFKLTCTAYDEVDQWFHASNVRLYLRHPNGNIITTVYQHNCDEYVK